MLKIYGVPISVHTRKVIVAAIEKGVAFENDPVIPFSPPPRWSELSPTGKIPVVTDGDFTLCDSSVICAYLERVHPAPALLPADARDYAKALWLEEYADGTMFRDVVHGLFFNKVIRPNMLKQAADQAAIDGILADALPRAFGYLETCIGGAHLAGGRLSIADIAILSNLINFHYLGYAIDKGRYPKLARYFADSLQQPSLKAALRSEQGVATGMGLDTGFLRAVAA